MSDEKATKCEHPKEMRGVWAVYKGPNMQHAIGWCCALCGLIQHTGETPGKPHWGAEVPL